MKSCALIPLIAFIAASAVLPASTANARLPATKTLETDIERGLYLVHISGCNDCHTPGYPESNGRTGEKLWLTGSPLGWSGPWGTTYASNLRLLLQNLTEAQWLRHARNEWRPPMPWFNLKAMRDDDLKAIYHYIRHLGPAGTPAPAYVPPDQEPKMPFVRFPAPPK